MSWRGRQRMWRKQSERMRRTTCSRRKTELERTALLERRCSRIKLFSTGSKRWCRKRGLKETSFDNLEHVDKHCFQTELYKKK